MRWLALTLGVAVSALSACAVDDTVLENSRCNLESSDPCGAGTGLVCDPSTHRCVFPAHLVAGPDAGLGGSTGGGSGGSTGGGTGGSTDDGGADAGATDAGAPDSGAPDAGSPDAGLPDAGPPDAGGSDAGLTDAGVLDAGPVCGPATTTILSPGPSPNLVLIRNLDADGKPDLAVTTAGDSNLTVYLRTSDGGFTAPVHYASCSQPKGLAAADFTNSGSDDLVVLCSLELDVFEHRDAGQFLAATTAHTFPSNQNQTAMDVGFIGGGVIPDVAVVDSAGHLSLLAKQSGYSFLVDNGLVVPSQVAAVRVVDLTSDGLPELVLTVSNASLPEVQVQLGAATLGFGWSPAINPTTCAPGAVAVADFDRDSKPDLVTTCSVANGSVVDVLLNVDAGVFVNRVSPAVGKNPAAVVTGDFNGDLRPDIVTGHACVTTPCTRLAFLAGEGDGGFKPAVAHDGGVDPRGLAAGDLNGDGEDDLVVLNSSAGQMTVILSAGPTCPLFR